MSPQLQYLETVLTCRGNFYAPDLHNHVNNLKEKLQQIIADDTNNLVLKKVEPWNSVRVTFNIPVDAARRLKELAERRDSILRELGILAVQIEGDRVISLTLESKSSDPSSAEVDVSFPTQSSESDRSETTASNRQRLEGQVLEGHQVLERNELSGTLTASHSSATIDGLINSSTNPVLSVYKEKVEKRLAPVGSVHVPISRNAECISASTALIHDSPNVNHLMNAQLIAYELQSLQQQFQQPSNFTNDISAQTSNGFAQARLNPDEERTIPMSLGILHPAQSPISRGWSRVEDRLPINNNIASSSPLLVNLLKSPGGRHPQPNILVPRLQNPDVFYPGAVAPQKRHRSQQRTTKRPKIELNANKPCNLSTTSVHHLDPSVIQDCTFSQIAAGQSVPGAVVSAAGLMIGDPFLTSTTIACLDSQKKQRFMINPYTGDLEEVYEMDDLDGYHESVFAKPSIETSRWQDGYGASAVSCVASASLPRSSQVSLCGFEEGTYQNETMKNQSPSFGHNGNSQANMLSDISVGLEVKDIFTSVRDSLKPTSSENSSTTSAPYNSLNSVSALRTFSKPKITSTTGDASHLYHLSSPEVSLLAGAAFLTNSSILPHVSLSHSDHQGAVTLIQSKPVTKSPFTAVGSDQMAAEALPVPGVPTSLSRLNDAAITASFQQFYSMTTRHNANSAVHPSSSLLAAPSSVGDLNQRIASDAVALPCTFTGAETERLQSSRVAAAAAGSVMTGQVGQMQPVVRSAISSKLAVGSQSCLAQIDKTESVSAPNAEASSAVLSVPSSFESVAAYPSASDVSSVQHTTSAHNEPPNDVKCSFQAEISEGNRSHLEKETSFTNDLKIPLTFPFDSLPQDLLSLSIAFSQNGRLPVMACPPNALGKPMNLSPDGKVLRANSFSNCHNYATAAAAAASAAAASAAAASASVLIGPRVLQKNLKVIDEEDVKSRLSTSNKDLTLPSEKSMSSSPLPGISCSKNIDDDQEIRTFSLPAVHTSDDVGSRATTVEDANPCSVIGKSVLSTESPSSSANDQSDLLQKHILSHNTQVIKSKESNPLQSFFHLPISGSQLTWDTKLMLPFGNLNALSVTGVTDSDYLRPYVADSATAQTTFEKLGCSAPLNPATAVSLVSLNPLCQKELPCDQSMNAVKIKHDIGLGRTEEHNVSADPIIPPGEVLSSNVTTPIGLQDIIVMQVSSSELQNSRPPSRLLFSVPFSSAVNSEVNASEVGEDAVGAETLRAPQRVSSSPFSGPAMRFALFSETKTFATREPSHRKSSRSADDSSPRSKATLTVAKLLEKAENEKMNLQPTSRLTESLENSLRQSQIPFSEPNTTSFPTETKMGTASSSAARTNFGNISVTCLTSKLSMNLPTSLARSFSMMDPNRLSITAPSYPLNLTESVQKVMQGVGLDTSPPPSPKPSASNRLSPAKFGGVLTSTGLSRGLPSYAGNLSVKTISESKSKDSTQTSPVAASSFVLTQTMSTTECHQAAVGGLSSNCDLAQQQKVDSSDSQTNSDEGVSLSSMFDQSENADFHLAMAPVLAEKRQLNENSLETSVDKPMCLPPFCSVDHSYSALPNPSAKASCPETLKDDFCDSIENLPDHLNSIEDCRDSEEQFHEITETFVNHFEDQDFFIGDLISSEGITIIDRMNEADSGNSNDCLEEEIEECIVDHVRESSDSVEADCSKELVTENSLQRQEERGEESSDMKTSEHQNDDLPSVEAELCESGVNVGTELPQILLNQNTLTEYNAEQMPPVEKTELLLGSTVLNNFPIDRIFSGKGENVLLRESAKDLGRHPTAGNCISAESLVPSKLPLRCTKNRKGSRNRKRNGGRLVRISSLDGKLEPSDESVKVTVEEESFEFITEAGTVISNESLASDESPFLLADSLKSLPSSGCMTTRSRGRKSTRTVRNADMLSADVAASGTAVASRCDSSPVALKLNENFQCLENPVLLRRSTRTLRKGESVSSGETNNCEHDTKPAATRSRKRPAKDVRVVAMGGSRSARSAEQNVVAEISEEYQEEVDSSQIPSIVESNRGGVLDHEEPATYSEGKEFPVRKSKT